MENGIGKYLIVIQLLAFIHLTENSVAQTTAKIDPAKVDTAKIDTANFRAEKGKDSTTFKEQIKGGGDSNKWYENKALPWIASSIVALLSVVVNIIISRATRKTSMEVVKTQIDTSIKIAAIQFHATLNSKNRQDWINETRNCLSEFLTQCRLYNIFLQESPQDKISRDNLNGNVSLYRNKLRLLLSIEIPEHSSLLKVIEELMNILEIHLLNSRSNIHAYSNIEFIQKTDELVGVGRKLLYAEWQKIQQAKFI